MLFPVSLENLKKTFVIQGVYRLEKFVIMSNVHRFIPINGLKITPLLIPYPLNPLVESPRGKLIHYARNLLSTDRKGFVLIQLQTH